MAKHFNKRHGDVLRAYDNMEIEEQFRQRNFALCFEINDLANGKKERLVKMTKDGFVLLVMSFTGSEAMKMKIAYINAFNAMAEQLQQIGMSLWSQRLELEKRDATSLMWANLPPTNCRWRQSRRSQCGQSSCH